MELRKQALYLSYGTVGYNILEGIVSLIAGYGAGSIALIGFGLDSFVESLSGSILIWRFRSAATLSKEEEKKREKQATRGVAYTFFLLGIYVLYESVTKLYFQEIPEPSLLGILIALLSLIAMPLLFFLKQRTGREMRSMSLLADSKQTLACAFLSFTLLIGLGMNYWFGVWQADPLIGLIIVFYLLKEGYTTLREEKVCSC